MRLQFYHLISYYVLFIVCLLSLVSKQLRLLNDDVDSNQPSVSNYFRYFFGQTFIPTNAFVLHQVRQTFLPPEKKPLSKSQFLISGFTTNTLVLPCFTLTIRASSFVGMSFPLFGDIPQALNN